MSKLVVLVMVSNPEDMKEPPLALLYLGNALKKNDYDVEVLHISCKDIAKCARRIGSLNPLFVGVSSITGNQTSHSAELSRAIRKSYNFPIVWGGVHVSLLPEQAIREAYIDYICIGEGDETIVELAQAFEGKRRFRDIKGLAYKENDKVTFTQPRPLSENIDNYKIDYSLVDVRKYLGAQWGCKRILTYVTSRGCVYNCTFCYNQKFNRGRWRAHAAGKVIQEITALKDQYDIDAVSFRDDFLFANQKRALDIIKGISLPWYGELRANIIDYKLVDELIKTECKEALFGFESGSDRILNLMNKRQTVAMIRNSVKLLSKAKDTRVVASFIFGVPTETQNEFFETVDLMLELNKLHPNMRYTPGFYLPYPGSAMYELAIKYGFTPPERTEDWSQLDRWSNKLKLTWLDWMQDSTYFMRARRYAHLLMLDNYGLPQWIRTLPESRLRAKDFSNTFELAILSWLQRQYAKKETAASKFISHILPLLNKNSAA